MSDVFDQPCRGVHEPETWQIKETKEAIKESDAGEFASDEDRGNAIRKYAS